jgi:adenylate cyclase
MDDRLPRKLAAILYADVAGYSRLTGEDEDTTHRHLSEHLDLISTNIKSHRGQVMHYAGDAVLARFEAVVDAVSSATDIQSLLAERNRDLPDEQKVQFRIGVNLGDVIEDRGDIYGDGVNIAARLESLAESGGICISESVRTSIGKKLDLSYENMGERELKNIAEPVKVYRVIVTGGVASTPSSNHPAPAMSVERPSIVVLPFQNMSKDAENDYFVDGITEEITTGLSRFREIVVAARGSSILIGTQSLDTAEAASRLGVRYALDGSVRRAGARVRITARLIDGETGHQIWSERYDRDLDDIFEVQDDVAQKIVVMLAGKIEQSDRERALRKETNSLSAYECVLHGRHLFGDWHGTKDNIRRSAEMFKRAIELDPRYAAAYAGLAAAYGEEFKYGWTSTPEVAGELSIELARKAIELDEHDSYAHLVLSNAYWRVKSNFELARKQLETAIELNPNYYWNYCYGCSFLVCAGDLDISVDYANEAIRRNPLLPDGCLWTLGFTEYLARRYENAIATVGRMTTLDSANFACLAACYAQLGRDAEAKMAAEEFFECNKRSSMDIADWRKYWRRLFNFKDQASIDHLIEGLDKAGLVTH